jgi:predicted enzyme related to lactoylglutathione lyase
MVNASFAVEGDARPHWRACFTVESTETVRELGGKVLVEPVEIGDGSLAAVLDPQGALFTLFAGEVDP